MNNKKNYTFFRMIFLIQDYLPIGCIASIYKF